MASVLAPMARESRLSLRLRAALASSSSRYDRSRRASSSSKASPRFAISRSPWRRDTPRDRLSESVARMDEPSSRKGTTTDWRSLLRRSVSMQMRVMVSRTKKKAKKLSICLRRSDRSWLMRTQPRTSPAAVTALVKRRAVKSCSKR